MIRKSCLWLSYAILTCILIGCNGGSGSSSGSGANSFNPPLESGMISVAVSPPGICSAKGNDNIPCVSVTICNPNTATPSVANCNTVPNVLLDTGSFGLRIFKQFTTNLNLTDISDGGGTLAECVNYGAGPSNWGPVVMADVVLAADATATNIPIQIIDSSFSGSSSVGCKNPATSPSDFGENGVLGVGPIVYDDGLYYSCNGNSCTSVSVPNNLMVINPIAALSSSNYNNGLTLKFPAVGTNGASGMTTDAIFGIGTNMDNQVISGVNVYPSFSSGDLPIDMPVKFNGSDLMGFLDTGSNYFFFDDSSIPKCNNINTSFYCPNSPMTLLPENQAESKIYIATSLDVANANQVFSTGNTAFSNIGDSLGGLLAGQFDYGLPFFFGKTVYIGFDGKSSSLDTGPYWAF